MNENVRQRLRSEQCQINRGLASVEGGRQPRGDGSELSARSVRYEIADRVKAVACGGIGAVHQVARKVGLIDALDTQLRSWSDVVRTARPITS